MTLTQVPAAGITRLLTPVPARVNRDSSSADLHSEEQHPYLQASANIDGSISMADDIYHIIVDSIQDYAIFMLDVEGHVLTWNNGARRLKGYEAHEIIGQHFSLFYVQADLLARKPERALVLALSEGRVEDEFWRMRKDGSQFWASVIITALYKDGRHIGFAKVTRDLTERRKSYAAVREAYEGAENSSRLSSPPRRTSSDPR